MDDLISEFITETSESLSVLDSELVKLEQNPNDSAILSNIFRLVHTIKGTCGFLGLPRLEVVAHASENVLGKIRDKEMEVSPKAVSLILESLDAIKSIMDHLGAHGTEPEGDDSDLIARLHHFVETKGADGGAPVSTPAATLKVVEVAPTLEPAAAAPVPEPVPAPAPAPAPTAVVEAPVPEKKAETPKAKEPKAPAPAEEKDTGGLSSQSIRVNLDVLENLMQMVGELVLTRNQLIQIARSRDDTVFMAPLQQLSHITTELQEGVMKTRMQPIGNAWAKFPRLIRDLSIELGKKIELRMIGAETELDRQLLEMIKDPLTHMVRNSCDHGLETPADRKAAGKPEVGTVTLSALHEGGHIIIEISDDGRGIHVDKVKEKAIKNGLATEHELDSMPEQQIIQFIFRAGFSTAEKVTSVSGRGVGMDVVKTNIEKIGGTIELRSVFGRGSAFFIKIPLTLAIVSVLIVRTGGERFAIPQINIVELVRVSSDSEYAIETIHGSPVLRLRDKLLPLISLANVLELDSATKPTEQFIVVCKLGNYDFGLIVDQVFDTEEIVVKPVTSLLQHLSIYSGNTILGDGSVIMILDPNGLARSVGELESRTQSTKEVTQRSSTSDRMISFLLFKAGKGAPKAVPLELVSRLEEIDTSKIEWSGDYPVVQYRGDLMRLMTLNSSYSIQETATREVVVFSYDNKVLGLIVEEIVDIVEAPLSVKMTSKEEGYLGSMVIAGKTTDVVDVGHLLKDLIDSAVSDGGAALKPPSRDVHLLLVEDSVFFRNLTIPFLTAVGYKVTGVSSGEEAFKLLHSKMKFDIIVSDIEMPEMDGFEFAELCKIQSDIADIPMIAFTSTINQQLLTRGREAGFRDVIVKTNREGLIRAISRELNLEKEAA